MTPVSTPTSEAVTPRERSFARACHLAAGAIAAYALGAWSVGRPDLAAFGAGFVAMAPTTSIVLLVLSVLGLTIAEGTPSRGRQRLAVSLVGFGLAIAALGFAEPLRLEVLLDSWFGGGDVEPSRPFGGRMSRYTAVLLCLLTVAMYDGLRSSDAARVRARWTAGIAALCAMLVSEGYLLGGAPLYGTTAMPIAAPTSFAISLLGIGTLLAVGRAPSSPSAFARMLRVPDGFGMLVLVTTVLAAGGGFAWWESHRRTHSTQVQEALRLVASSKADQIDEWLNGHLSTGRVLEAIRWPRGAFRAPLDPQLERWVRSVVTSEGYAESALIAADGTVLAAYGKMDSMHWAAFAARQAAGSEPRIAITDLHLHEGGSRLDLWIPLHTIDVETPPAWLFLSIDPEPSLFAPWRDEPSAAQTLEVALWRDDGDVATILNNPQPDDTTALRYRVPLSAPPTTLEGQALRQASAPSFGQNFRGRDVAWASSRPKSRPWTVVATIDREEFLAPVGRNALSAILLSLGILGGTVAAGVALLSRRELAAATRELELVAERERSAAELSASERRFARAIHATSDGVWEWSVGSECVYRSSRWREILGIPEDAPMGSIAEHVQRVHPDDAPRVSATLDALVTHDVPYDVEYRVEHHDGRWRWVRDRATVERDETGRALLVTGAMSDITARKMLERAVQRTDRVLRVRSACNLALVRAPDEQTLLTTVCDVAVREGGYRMSWIGFAEESPGRPVRVMASSGAVGTYLSRAQISWDQNAATGQGPTGRCISTGEAQAAQDIAHDPRFAQWREAALAMGFASSCAVPLQLQGRVIGAFMLYADEPFAFDAAELALLSELGNDIAFGIAAKRDQRAVAAQQAQLTLFRAVIERSSDAIFVSDAPTGRFIDFNATAAQSLGYTSDELLTLDVNDITDTPGDAASYRRLIESLRVDGPSVSATTHRRKDGTRFPVEVARTLLSADGQEWVLSVARDVSERNALQEQLLQSQKLEGLGRLAGGIAHDFNNLLTVINATADLAASSLAPRDERRADFEQIRGAGQRAATLTAQLLSFSRRQVMHQRVLDLGAVTERFGGLLRRVIGEDVRLELRHPASPLWVNADPGLLEQILMNLAVNARDAMPQGGTIVVDISHVTLDEDFTTHHPTTVVGPHARLSVRDTGVGMSEEVLARVFEPFFTTKPAGQGTGLGLATVYGLVKQMGGSIWFTSSVGAGTTADVYFPLVAAPAPATDGGLAPQQMHGRETILVVEDEASIRLVARRVLERAGYTVLTAEDAQDALQQLATLERPVHLLLTDVVMPGMPGTELAMRVRAAFPSIRVLLASGYSQELLAQRAAGVSPFPLLTKPYSMDELTRAVRTVLDTALPDEPINTPTPR